MLPSPTPRSPRTPPAAAVLVVAVIVAALVALAVRSGGGPDGAATIGAPATTLPLSPDPEGPTHPDPAFAELQQQIAAIRGLPWLRPLDLQVVSARRLGQEVRRVIERDANREQAAADEALLKLLDLVPADLDVTALLGDLLSEQVLGFYDGTTKQLFVAGDGTSLDPATRFVIVHEMVHALTDQHFDFASRMRALQREGRAEEQAAFSALAEGDATLAQLAWAEAHLSRSDMAAALLGSGSGSQVLDRTPAYLQRALFFPYESGLAYASALHRDGGFARIDAAYRTPPTSTEHILHPELFLAGQPATGPGLPPGVGSGCDVLRRGALGEFDTREVLARHVPAREATRAGEGWNGDSFVLLRCGGAHALVDRWRGDRPSDLTELVGALRTWARAWSGGGEPAPDGRFGGSRGAGRIRVVGDTVEVIVTRDATVAQRLVEALG